jgi:hypothetical protein
MASSAEGATECTFLNATMSRRSNAHVQILVGCQHAYFLHAFRADRFFDKYLGPRSPAVAARG